MAFAYSRLREIKWLAVTAGELYTNPTGSTSYVRLIAIHNTHSLSEAVTLYNVPDSSAATGTAATANQFYKATVSVEDTVFIEMPTPGFVLTGSHDTIQGVAHTGSKVTVQIYGGIE